MDEPERLQAALEAAQARADAAMREAEHLRASEARYRSFFALSSEGVWRVDTDTPIDTTLPVAAQVEACFRVGFLAECNAAFARMYGYDDPDALIGARLTDLMPPSDPRNAAYLQAFIEGGYRLTDAESYEVDREGRPRVFENALVGEIQDGRLVRAWGTQRDVTERVWAEEAVRESEARLRVLFDNAPVALVLVSLEGRYLDANPAFCTLVGRPRTEIVGQPVTAFIPPDAEQDYARIRAQILETGTWSGAFPLLHADGHVVFAEWRMGDYPVPGIYLASATDITARHAAEAALRESEGRFRHLADHVPAMIWLTDADGHAVYLNRAWSVFTGQATDEALAYGWADAIHPDDQDRTIVAFAEAAAHQAPVRLLYRIRRHDGVYRWALDEAMPRFDEAGVFLGHAGYVADVSDRVDAETALRDLNATLEARVAERTAELERSNRDLQSFAQVASHDLQEPLRKIQSFADLLQQDFAAVLGEDGARYVDRMRDAAARMGHLMQALLGFARVATKARPFESVNLNHTLATVRDDVEVRLLETGGRVEADGALPTVEADPVQMHQLLLNLVGNALKFHRPGVPPVVRVTATADGGAVRLTVEDNGIGFDPRFAEQIFEPFHRLHGRGTYEGSGMGLSIVRRIAERHGGTATAEGRPGVGSRFQVALPARQTEPGAPAPPPG